MTKTLAQKVPSVVIALLLWSLVAAVPVAADLRVESTIIATNSQGIGGGEVESITYLKGAWLRREAAGEGRIASILADKIIILNRLTGERLSLYVDDKVYRVDTLPDVNCGPEWIADMRMLGQSASPIPATVTFPDSSIEVLGHSAQLVQIAIAPTNAPGGSRTLLRFWMTSDYAEVFGADYRKDLFCDDADEGVTNRDDFAAAWGRQFSLSREAVDSIREHVEGYPLKMEILGGQTGGVKTSTVITTVKIDQSDLPDSLFAPPSDYKPYEGKAEELWKSMKQSLQKDFESKDSGENN